jgi:hypothetical protein
LNKKWLFGAEINKIQDTVFRASLQRQVVGGSRLLVAFGDEATAKAKKDHDLDDDGILVSGRGGNFRLVFADEKNARRFGEQLATAYHLLLDGAITVADPHPFDDSEDAAQSEGFAAANESITQQLQARKRSTAHRRDTPHAPTTAYCQSSGVGLAAHYKQPVPGQGDNQYLAKTAFIKRETGYQVKDGGDPFLLEITKKLDTKYQKYEWIKSPESASGLDVGRRNVAYLVADGNNMGKLFRRCRRPEELKQLSAALDSVVKIAIADAVSHLLDEKAVRTVEEKDAEQEKTPFMPLIVAGDDIFILTPAPHALDFARLFCRRFEQLMEKQEIVVQLQKRYEKETEKEPPPPTMAAAVVFCKQSYPYHLAHERGETLLKETKRVIKTVGGDGGGWHSAVSFDVLMGSELARSQNQDEREYRPHLITYWADDNVDDGIALQAALPLKRLVEGRKFLADEKFPNKRLAEVRQLYTPEMVPNSIGDADTRWRKALNYLRQRMQATDKTGQEEQWRLLQNALQRLGDSNPTKDNPGCWRDMERAGTVFKGHGILDLLSAWPYLDYMDEPDWMEEAA